jgi:hypothetical protein
MAEKADPAADLLKEIEAFLALTGMGPSHFGKQACGNSELVERLRKGKDVHTRTAKAARDYIAAHRPERQEEAMQSAALAG